MDDHKLLGNLPSPTEGWMECPVPGCKCRMTWSFDPALAEQVRFIREGGTVIDVGKERTADSLHGLLANSLGFPPYYGRNWDAFWDCVTDRDCVLPSKLMIAGLAFLRENLPNDARQLERCLLELADVRPECSVTRV